VSRSKVKVKKMVSDHHVWDIKCLERQLANWLTWTGILMSTFVWDVKSYDICYVVFDISVSVS
jgi:hypothetical protein